MPRREMRRREFITLLGGAAALSANLCPLVAHAQPRERVRRVGALMTLAANDQEAPNRISAFAQELQQLGWTIGRNLQVDYRWSAGSTDDTRKYAAELAALSPEVILANGSPAMTALQQTARSVPIVFVSVVDPVGAGFVDSLARPGGNATGFTSMEYGMSGKWLQLLKEIAPQVTRVAVLRDTSIAAGIGQLGAIQSLAPLLGVEIRPIGLRDASEIERGISAFARGTNGGLIATGSALT